jgi:hypothetical protein
VLGVVIFSVVRRLKVAVTLFVPFITREVGLVVPVRSPVQPLKAYPELAVAEMDALCPLLYQFVPEGLTVPPAEGLAPVDKLYCVVKLAV